MEANFDTTDSAAFLLTFTPAFNPNTDFVGITACANSRLNPQGVVPFSNHPLLVFRKYFVQEHDYSQQWHV
jgi:hypothetical protein